MIDDILGLIILAVVSSVVIHGRVDVMVLVKIILSAVLFFAGVLLIGPWLLRRAARFFEQFLEPWETKLFISFIFVMALAWLATLANLATIIGAFAAGLILNDEFFVSDKETRKENTSIRALIAPLESILSPLFFILIGIQVKLETFFNWQVIGLSFGLIVAAILGKLVSGLGGGRRDDALLIGIGMLPRGEVGLVFASIGRTLGVISDSLFAAIVLMVIVTTLIAPFFLKRRYAQRDMKNHEYQLK